MPSLKEAYYCTFEYERALAVCDNAYCILDGISLVISVFGLFGIGAGVSLTASSPLWKAGGRQILLGLLAAGITFGLGRLIGSAVG